MSTESKALITKLVTLRDLLVAKNCGTGPGGFQPGNTCGRRGGGNSAEGSARRKRSGKRRRSGPNSGIGPASRKARRRRAGRKNASRRKWRERLMASPNAQSERVLYRRQAGERKELADTIKAERKEARSDEKASRKDLAKELKTERKETRRDQTKERAKLKKDQEKEIAKETRDFDKREASLDAKYEAAKPKAKDPDALDENYRERKQELAAERAERMQDLSDEHWQARKDLRDSHKIDRENERADHQSRAEDLKNDQRSARFTDHLSHREQAYDLHESHRAERAEELRDLRLPDDKAIDDIETKAADDTEPDTPTADAILRAALSTTGHTDAWEAGTLSDEGAMELLHQIRMDARAWFRAEAQAVLDEVTGLEAKALFGDAKAKVGAFFSKAKRHVREIIAAGILAVAGPGPVLQQEAIADPYRQQVEIQSEYLADFRKQIVAEAKPLDGTFVARAEMYGSAAWTAPQTIFRAAAKNSKVFNFEWREHLGPRAPTDPCSVCDSQEKQGRKPIGTLKAIGDSPCKCNCHCTFYFSVTADGPGYACGRGPLFEPAFGATG